MPDDSPNSARRSVLRRITIFVLRICLFGYATVLVALVILETRLVFPGAYMDIAPYPNAKIGAVHYRAADGTKLSGQLYDKDGSQHTVLFLHGNGITAARQTEMILRLGDSLNATVLAAEYRGFDGLQGTPSEAAVIEDSMAARDFICEHRSIAKADLVLVGQSLGGGCAVAVAADSGAKVLALDRTFDSTVEVAAGMFWFVPIKILMRNRFDSVTRIAKYNGPLVQMHGTTDNVIPIKHGKRLHDSAMCEPKHWVEVDGMGHNDGCPPEAWNRFCTKIRDCLDIGELATGSTE